MKKLIIKEKPPHTQNSLPLRICIKMPNLLWFQILAISLAGVVEVSNGGKYSRDDFPTNFVFGSGTSAYQVYFYQIPL